MATRKAQIVPTLKEKRYYTIQFLEAATVGGSPTLIRTVESYSLSRLSKEQITLSEEKLPVHVIFEERPKPSLLQRLGWEKEKIGNAILAYIPTHILRNIETGEVENYYFLKNKDIKLLVEVENTPDGAINACDIYNPDGTPRVPDEACKYYLEPLKITRGALIDIQYDFVPKGTKESMFYVTDVQVDLVSLNYIAALMPYKYDIDPEDIDKENVDNNIIYLNIDSDNLGLDANELKQNDGAECPADPFGLPTNDNL